MLIDRLGRKLGQRSFCLSGALFHASNQFWVTREYRTLREDRAHFNADAVPQRCVCPRDFDRLIETVGLEHEITAHRFFRFHERSVEDEPSVRARDYPAL